MSLNAQIRTARPSLTVGVVVPNFNGARFLRECIDSIIGQVYPIECLVMDGGSQDESVEILRSYGTSIRYISRKDRGQADAIAQGFSMLQTDLVGWINSDDRYLPGAVELVVRTAEGRPDAVLIHGDVDRIDEHGSVVGRSVSKDTDYEKHRRGRGRTVQPGSFYRRWAVQACGGVDARFHLLMDVDLWIRLLAEGPAVRIPNTLAEFRVHPAAKSSSGSVYRYYRETLMLGWEHERDRRARAMFRRGLRILLTHARWTLSQWRAGQH